MRRLLIVFALVPSFALSACMPGIPQASSSQSQATTIAMAGTQAAYTLAALPTLTLPPSNTPLPTFTRTAAPTATDASTKTATIAPATATANGTQAATTTLTQAGSATPTLTFTGTVPGTTTGTAIGTATITKTPTPGVLLWGTVPPEVPYGRVHLINNTSDMVYISFHCILENGLTSYLEYPVYSKLTVSIPAGPCHYIAWVKGKEFTGDIRIKKLLEYTFIFKNKKILISQP